MKRAMPYRKSSRRMKRSKRTVDFKAAGRPRRQTDILTFKRVRYTGSWVFSTVSTSGFWRYKTHTANVDINKFSELAEVFDEYKIRAIKVTYRPRWSEVTATDAAGSVAGTTAQPLAYAHVVVDPGSTVSPTGTYSQATVNSFLENSGVKTYPLTKEFSIYYKPKCSDTVFGGGNATRVFNGGWIKTDQTAVDFRGFHMLIQQNNMSSTGSYVLDEYVTVYMQCKNLK